MESVVGTSNIPGLPESFGALEVSEAAVNGLVVAGVVALVAAGVYTTVTGKFPFSKSQGNFSRSSSSSSFSTSNNFASAA